MAKPPPNRLAVQFSEIILSEMDRRGISMIKFSEMLGVHRKTASQLLNAPGNVSTDVILRYMHALDLEPDLFARPKAPDESNHAD